MAAPLAVQLAVVKVDPWVVLMAALTGAQWAVYSADSTEFSKVWCSAD